MSKLDYAAIHTEATVAAKAAAREYLEKYGDNDCCGFAWVKIRPARGAFVSYLKSVGVGDKGWNGGWEIWNPSGVGCQSLTPLENGARAYCDVIKKHMPEIEIFMGSRMD